MLHQTINITENTLSHEETTKPFIVGDGLVLGYVHFADKTIYLQNVRNPLLCLHQ